MSEYIKREDVERAIKSCKRISGEPLDDYDTMMVWEIIDLIDCIPAANVVPFVEAEKIDSKLKKVFKSLRSNYERAKKTAFVRDPIAWSLYQTWKEFDGKNITYRGD